jgi:hypothetical protein
MNFEDVPDYEGIKNFFNRVIKNGDFKWDKLEKNLPQLQTKDHRVQRAVGDNYQVINEPHDLTPLVPHKASANYLSSSCYKNYPKLKNR